MKRLPGFGMILLMILTANGLRSQHQTDEEYDKPLRIEIPAKSDNETYRVIPCGTTGVMLFFKSLESEEDTLSRWYFSFYDENLQPIWAKGIPLPGQLNFQSVIFKRDTLYMLFLPGEKEKQTRFILLRIGLFGAVFIANPAQMPQMASFAALGIEKGKAMIAYNLKNASARIQVLELSTGNSMSFAVSSDTISSLTDMTTDPGTGDMLVCIRKRISRTDNEYFLKKFDLQGKSLATILISPIVANWEIHSLRFFVRDSSEILVLGTYGSPARQKSTSKKTDHPESTGFFFSNILGNQQRNINFINFLELKNSDNLLGEKDILELKKKSLKKNKSQREYSLDFNLLLHPLIRHNDQFILLAETYYPQYHSENFTDYDFYGRPFTSSYNIFDGYRFSNAIVAGFSRDGKLLWDNNIELRNLLSFQLNPEIVHYFSGNDIVLAYLSEGRIASKIIREDKVVEKLDFSSLDLLYPGDKLISETKSHLVNWYDRYFLAYGYQQIKNIIEGKKRLTFYMTKVRFE